MSSFSLTGFVHEPPAARAGKVDCGPAAEHAGDIADSSACGPAAALEPGWAAARGTEAAACVTAAGEDQGAAVDGITRDDAACAASACDDAACAQPGAAQEVAGSAASNAIVGDTKGAFSTDGVIRQTYVGGQALIEGVMMRGHKTWAVAVREADGGIYTEQHELAFGREGYRWLRLPVIRGIAAFIQSLVLGYQALQVSAEHAIDIGEEGEEVNAAGVAGAVMAHSLSCLLQAALGIGEPELKGSASDAASADPARPDPPAARATGTAGSPGWGEPVGEVDAAGKSEPESKGLVAVSMGIGFALGVVLFVVVPALLANLLVGDYTKGTFAWNLVDGIGRVAILVGYLAIISLLPDIRRLFAYHGAEHKTIHCYEHAVPLTPSNAMRFPRLHVRCGTAFLLMTMLIAILVFTLLPLDPLIEAVGVTNHAGRLALVILSRIVLFPLVAGLAYEVTVKWAGAHPEKPAVRVVLWPGLQLQRLTTNLPDEGMLECAIAAMQLVLSREDDIAQPAVAAGS